MAATAVHLADRVFPDIPVRQWNAPARAWRARRDLRVLPRDLVVSGPGPAAVEALLKRESDPHEPRQVEILRTEREIFERCLATLPGLGLHAELACHLEFRAVGAVKLA